MTAQTKNKPWKRNEEKLTQNGNKRMYKISYELPGKSLKAF